MPKVAFIGKNELSNIFKVLGMDTVLFKSPSDLDKVKDYDFLLTEDALYQELEQRFPDKIIISLVDFPRYENSLISRARGFIRDTVGEEVLGDA